MGNRTERIDRIHLRITSEIKKDIDRRRSVDLTFSLVDWFEEKYKQEFLPKQQNMDKIAQLKQELTMREAALNTIAKAEREATKILLQKNEIMDLQRAVTKFNSLDEQYQVFISLVKKDISKEQFMELRERYV